jgi:hypothetical protein
LLGEARHHDHEGEAPGAQHDDRDSHENDHGLPDGEDHHHDLAVLDGGKWMKSAELKTSLPNWVPLDVAMAGRLVIPLREGREIALLSMREHAPPADQRVSGWLLVVQTARPVRGPSLIA